MSEERPGRSGKKRPSVRNLNEESSNEKRSTIHPPPSVSGYGTRFTGEEKELQCGKCVKTALKMKNNCPSCGKEISNPETELIMNFIVAKIADKFRESERKRRLRFLPSTSTEEPRPCASTYKPPSNESFTSFLSDPHLNVDSVSRMINALESKRLELETGDRASQTLLLLGFFDEMIQKRQMNLEKLSQELSVLRSDREKAAQKLNPGTDVAQQLVPESSESISVKQEISEPNSRSRARVPDLGKGLANRRQRMISHYPDLEEYYLNHRLKQSSGLGGGDAVDVEEFGGMLSKLTRYENARRLATLNYSVEACGGLSIVSSIEFDKDGEYFGVAGVTKRIKLYDYNSVVSSPVDLHYPVGEMHCSSKISSICWNSYAKSLLASSDYEGSVLLWDAWAGKTTQRLMEHEKRCWSVNFSPADPKLLSSGSDDSKVKIWAVNVPRSVAQINAGVNVCCVRFSPTSPYHLAFGSADHCVHYYDIRNTKSAVNVFKGHKKAVSYVLFCSSDEIVSASTDSHLRVWSVKEGKCIRDLRGHHNEKNFVGLATGGDFIACGSETNDLYVYYKALTRPVISYGFNSPDSSTSNEGSNPSGSGVQLSRSSNVTSSRSGKEGAESSDFVSALCWKQNSSVLVAANSQGAIQILELV